MRFAAILAALGLSAEASSLRMSFSEFEKAAAGPAAALAAPPAKGAKAAPRPRAKALQAALIALYENGGGVLELEAGTYEVCEEVDLNPVRPPRDWTGSGGPTLIVRGAGGEAQGVTLQCAGGWKDKRTDACFLRFRGQNGAVPAYSIWLEHVSVAGGDSAAWLGVTGMRVSDRRVAIHLKDVHFRNLRHGLQLNEGVGRFIVEYCKFAGISGFAVDASGSGDGSVSRCEFAGIGMRGSASPSAAIHAKANTVISENIFGTCEGPAILVRPDYSGEVTVTHNEFDRNGWIMDFGDKSAQSVKDAHATTNCEFSGNKVLGWNGRGDIYGRKDDPAQKGWIRGSHVARLTVTGNKFAGLAAEGIGFDLSGAEDVRVSGNSFSPDWATTWQPILGRLFRIRDARGLEIHDNAVETGLGEVQPVPWAEFSRVEGVVRNNRFRGTALGIAADSDSRLDFSGNAAAGKRSVFADSAGWITVPDESRILGGDSGRPLLRKCRLELPLPRAFVPGRPDTLFTVGLPGPAPAGGRFRVRVHARAAGVPAPAVYAQEIEIVAGADAKRKRAAAPSAGKDSGWGPGSFEAASSASGRETAVRFSAAAPRAAGFTALVELEYETWGQVRVK